MNASRQLLVYLEAGSCHIAGKYAIRLCNANNIVVINILILSYGRLRSDLLARMHLESSFSLF